MNELPSVAEHAKSYNIIAQKSLGQNFLLDLNLCQKIVRAAGTVTAKTVLEIGPGVGGLTRAILQQNPQRLVVIEKDSRCLNLLEDIKRCYQQLEIVMGDAATHQVSELGEGKLMIIGNLPYNIGTWLLCKWLFQLTNVESITLTLQEEVVNRICGIPNSALYGRLSIICQLMCDVEYKFHISPQAFYPAPKVHSAVVHLVPKKKLLTCKQLECVGEVTQVAFSQRRKMLKSALKPLSSMIENLLNTLEIDSTLRPQQLSPHHYLDLAKLLYPQHFNESVETLN